MRDVCLGEKKEKERFFREFIMEKKQYIKPTIADMAVETMGPIAVSGEFINYEDYTDVDANDGQKPDKELWGGGTSDSSDGGYYWIGE